jgi:hypothetical protein
MNARYVFKYNTNDVVADAMYYARIQAIKAWYRANADDWPMPNTKAEWSSIYLTEEQYLEVNKLLHLISHEAMYLLALFKKIHVGVGVVDGHPIRRLSGLMQMVGFPWVSCHFQKGTGETMGLSRSTTTAVMVMCAWLSKW